MAGKRNGKKPRRPKFPRRRWKPGQVERVEKPVKGSGYERRRQQRDAEQEIEEGLDETRRSDESPRPNGDR